MRFTESVPQTVAETRRERRRGFGEMSDAEIAAYVDALAGDPEGLKKILRRMIRAQRAMLRHMTKSGA